MPYISTEYYDLIYAKNKDYSREAKILNASISKHKKAKGNTLLDVACGTGQHIQYLKEHFKCTGMDINPDFLKVAKLKNDECDFFEGDMTSFHVPERYSVVTCLFSSIGYVADKTVLASTIAIMKEHLEPGGVLVIEPWYTPETFLPGHYSGVFGETSSIKVARMNHWSRNGNGSVGESQILIASTTGIQHIKETHHLALFSHQEYLDALKKSFAHAEYDAEGLTGRGLYTAYND